MKIELFFKKETLTIDIATLIHTFGIKLNKEQMKHNEKATKEAFVITNATIAFTLRFIWLCVLI